MSRHSMTFVIGWNLIDDTQSDNNLTMRGGYKECDGNLALNMEFIMQKKLVISKAETFRCKIATLQRHIRPFSVQPNASPLSSYI